MPEININMTNMAAQTDSLNSIIQSLCSACPVLPEPKGEGPVAADAQDLGRQITETGKSLEILFENTVVFLNNAGESFRNTDASASAGYKEQG